MKKAICMVLILLMTGCLAGCKEAETKQNTGINYTPTAKPAGAENSENSSIENNAEGSTEQKDTIEQKNTVEQKNRIELKDIAEIDFTYDYTEDHEVSTQITILK